MNVTASDAVSPGAYATFGVLGTMSAVWVFVETLNAQEQNLRRIRTAALAVVHFHDRSLDFWRLLVPAFLSRGESRHL